MVDLSEAAKLAKIHVEGRKVTGSMVDVLAEAVLELGYRNRDSKTRVAELKQIVDALLKEDHPGMKWSANLLSLTIAYRRNHCDHDNVSIGSDKCLDCGTEFIYCRACSAEGSVHHTAPECETRR